MGCSQSGDKTVFITSAVGLEPHNKLDDSISTQGLLKSQFYSATYQVFPGTLRWHGRAAPAEGDETQTDEPSSGDCLALSRTWSPTALSILRAKLCLWGKRVTIFLKKN